MRVKYWWLALGLIVAAALVLASCGPAATTTTASPPTTTKPAATTTVAPTTAKPAVERPKYGGTYTEILTSEPAGFDVLVVQTNFIPSLQVTSDTLAGGQWAKGPAGTAETSWLFGYLGRTDLWGGQIAESWEIPDNETIIYHIRKGVKWMQRAPGNGREMTATDVAWSIESEWKTPGTNFAVYFAKEQHLISATATDKYTVVLKVPAKAMGTNFMENSEREFIRNPDVTKVYGNQNEWKNMDTTGPFYIIDYVRGSSLTYARNPNYWETNPVGPGKGDQLPYVDGVKQLIILDTSTQLAAFRTAKVDIFRNLNWEDSKDMIKRNPAIKSIQTFATSVALPAGRVDKPELPFKDVKVRRALNMAVNKQEMVEKYYQGNADLFGWPFFNTKEHQPFYTPLNQMPASVQELYVYNPDKAKQLLKEAGYPNGFKTKIAVSSAGPDADALTIIREYLLKVGVDMQIQVMEPTVYRNVMTARTHEEMLIRPAVMPGMPFMIHEIRVDSAGNHSMWQDDQTLAVWQTIQDNIGRNDAKWYKAVKDVMPHVLDEAPYIFVPAPYVYHIWWPWVQNFRGEVSTGYARSWRHLRYLFVDQDLKRSMGY
jgi:peptide/nickel transport system substrate-binding protein